MATEKGHSQAMNNLAICYQNGDGVAKNLKKATELYKKSFQFGCVNAGFNQAYCFQKGLHYTVNLRKAAELYEKVGDLGESEGYV